MKLNELTDNFGSAKKPRRVGRGIGSGSGKTSGRGHKGAKSRSGYSKKIGFEGGQQPLQRRLPKFGFNSPNRVEYNVVNLDTIESLIKSKKLKSKINKIDLISNGLVQKNDLVKILSRGEITMKIDITANAFSKSAKLKLEKIGSIAQISKK